MTHLEEVEVEGGDVGDLDDGDDGVGLDVGRAVDDVLLGADAVGCLSRALAADLVDLGQVLLEDVRRHEVDFGHDDDEGDLEREAQRHVLLGHVRHAHVGAHQNKRVVGVYRCEPVDGRLEVPLVARHVEEGDDLG